MTSADAARRRHELRELILSKNGARFRKVAMVMLEISEHAPSPEQQAEQLYCEDEIVGEISALITMGQLEIVGDLTRPRNSEIRLRQS